MFYSSLYTIKRDVKLRFFSEEIAYFVFVKKISIEFFKGVISFVEFYEKSVIFISFYFIE